MQTIDEWLLPVGVFWSVEDIQQVMNVSRSAAYQLMRELPDDSKLRVIPDNSPRTYLVARPEAIKLAWASHRGRGNPKFRDPRFQAEMARKRHQKA